MAALSLQALSLQALLPAASWLAASWLAARVQGAPLRVAFSSGRRVGVAPG